ncbi:MAG: hypothetical protein JWO09_145 [Bacteroidetes bacterium]|nr:hypothetical protein [Bacteroidota bacterium]
MNFEEAKQSKANIGNTSEVMDEPGRVTVTPTQPDDFEKYKEHVFNEWPFPVSDEDAKLFCRNNIYRVRALTMHESSNTIVWKDL